jgi:hypothetical protein
MAGQIIESAPITTMNVIADKVSWRNWFLTVIIRFIRSSLVPSHPDSFSWSPASDAVLVEQGAGHGESTYNDLNFHRCAVAWETEASLGVSISIPREYLNRFSEGGMAGNRAPVFRIFSGTALISSTSIHGSGFELFIHVLRWKEWVGLDCAAALARGPSLVRSPDSCRCFQWEKTLNCAMAIINASQESRSPPDTTAYARHQQLSFNLSIEGLSHPDPKRFRPLSDALP